MLTNKVSVRLDGGVDSQALLVNLQRKIDALKSFRDALQAGPQVLLDKHLLAVVAREFRYDYRICPNNRSVASAMDLVSKYHIPHGTAVAVPFISNWRGTDAGDTGRITFEAITV